VVSQTFFNYFALSISQLGSKKLTCFALALATLLQMQHSNAFENRKFIPFGSPINRSKNKYLMKSRIRSRWHRPNEKPLENHGSASPVTAPMGEIDSQNLTSLTDDLSDYKPSSNTKEHSRSRDDNDSSGRRSERSRSRPPRSRGRNDRNKPRQNRENSSDKGGESKEASKHPNRKSRRRKPNGDKQDSDRSRKPHNKNSSSRPKQESKPKKEGGLKGFLGKLFG